MEIHSKVHVGGDTDYGRVKGRAGWSWLRCCKYGVDGHQKLLGYHTLAAPDGKSKYWVRKGNLLALNLLDLDDPNFISKDMIDVALLFIKERLEAGDNLAICCNGGRSRGPSIALLYLRSIGEMPHSFVWAEKIFRVLYPAYDPSAGIRQYVRMHW